MSKSQDKTSKNPVGRRGFLKGAAAEAAALVAEPSRLESAREAQAQAKGAATGLPSARLAAAESAPPPPRVDVYTTDRPGSDFMVDVIKTLGFEYVCANPGSSFRGLHESFVNYGHNKTPELLTCCHEESSVAMAHGYAKIEGKPLMIMAHGTVGLQHASMAIYNAFADRVPVYVVSRQYRGCGLARSDVEWAPARIRDIAENDVYGHTIRKSVVNRHRRVLQPYRSMGHNHERAYPRSWRIRTRLPAFSSWQRVKQFRSCYWSGMNRLPNCFRCCEESSVAMAHGYAKIEGKPLMIMAHGTVGLQHASMAIYNAFADRVPVYVVLGNIADAGWRPLDIAAAPYIRDIAENVYCTILRVIIACERLAADAGVSVRHRDRLTLHGSA